MEKKRNLWVIPTDKPSRLIYNDANQLCYQSNKSYKNDRKWMHRKKFNIYITNSEEIKEGDWVYHYASHKMFKYDGHGLCVEVKKIILTTDQDLIKDGVQAIDNGFLEWFVKNPSCESVEIENTCLEVRVCDCAMNENCLKPGYKIIISQEEPKQEIAGKAFYESADKVITVTRQENV